MTLELQQPERMTVEGAARALGHLRHIPTAAIGEVAQLCLFALSVNSDDYNAQLVLRLIGKTLRDREGLS